MKVDETTCVKDEVVTSSLSFAPSFHSFRLQSWLSVESYATGKHLAVSHLFKVCGSWDYFDLKLTRVTSASLSPLGQSLDDVRDRLLSVKVENKRT